MNRELITKKDYEILGINENTEPKEINSAYEKLLQKYHPEKIKLKELREPNDLEIKKYKEIEKVYKKFDLEPKKYICCGRKNGE
jgi:preprotein translocase subunit Sec63